MHSSHSSFPNANQVCERPCFETSITPWGPDPPRHIPHPSLSLTPRSAFPEEQRLRGIKAERSPSGNHQAGARGEGADCGDPADPPAHRCACLGPAEPREPGKGCRDLAVPAGARHKGHHTKPATEAAPHGHDTCTLPNGAGGQHGAVHLLAPQCSRPASRARNRQPRTAVGGDGCSRT